MRIYTSIVILFFSISGSTVLGQDTLTQKLTDKYWGINKYGLVSLMNSDTLQLDRVADIEAILTPPYKGGFVFYQDGRFVEILHRSCGYDRQAYTGTWSLEKDTVVVKINKDLIWYFQIIVLTEDSLKTKYWVENKD